MGLIPVRLFLSLELMSALMHFPLLDDHIEVLSSKPAWFTAHALLVVALWAGISQTVLAGCIVGCRGI